MLYQNDIHEQRLIAYSSTASDPVNAERLREHLTTLLPDYMEPAVFVPVDNFKLTHNRKIDRSALPAVESGGGYYSNGYEEPATDSEAKLAALLPMFECERIGRTDNFFELGGHSLLAMKLIARIQQTFSVEVPLRMVFDHPTVQQLADAIDTVGWFANDVPASADDDVEEGEL